MFPTSTHSITAERGLSSISRESVEGEKRLKYVVLHSGGIACRETRQLKDSSRLFSLFQVARECLLLRLPVWSLSYYYTCHRSPIKPRLESWDITDVFPLPKIQSQWSYSRIPVISRKIRLLAVQNFFAEAGWWDPNIRSCIQRSILGHRIYSGAPANIDSPSVDNSSNASMRQRWGAARKTAPQFEDWRGKILM